MKNLQENEKQDVNQIWTQSILKRLSLGVARLALIWIRLAKKQRSFIILDATSELVMPGGIDGIPSNYYPLI
jgi:hypothetical protein